MSTYAAGTSYATGNAATQKLWAKNWWLESKRETYFYAQGMVGPDAEAKPIVEMNDLQKNKGDTITWGQFRRLSGAGVSGDGEMESNEETLVDYTDTVTINQVRNAVRLDGAMTEQRHAANNLRASVKEMLKRWMGEKLDNDIFAALGDSCTNVFFPTGAAAVTDLTSSHKLTLALLSKVKVFAKLTTPRIMPMRIEGREHFVLLAHPQCVYDIKVSDSNWATYQQYAQERGKTNPLFTGAAGAVDGIIIHEHESVPSSTTWGSGAVTGANNLFLGTGAAVLAIAKQKQWVEKVFDYDNQWGCCVKAIYGMSKAVLNGEDHAVVGIKTYRTPTDAS